MANHGNRWHPSLIDVAAKLAKTGATDEQIISGLDCSERSFYRWLKQREEFRSAIHEARTAEVQQSDLDELERRKRAANKWITDYLESQGKIIETQVNTKNGYTRTKSGGMPDMKLIGRILGQQDTQEFTLNISIAEPDADEDDLD